MMNLTEDVVASSSTSTEISPFRYVSMEDLRSDATIVITGFLFIAIMVAITVGNVVVIVAILTHRTLKNQKSNLFILNLAIADLMVVFGVMIWTSISLTMDYGSSEGNSWALSEVVCMLQCAMNYCLIVVSMMTLGFISVDRLVHILYPLRYPEICTPIRIKITIIWTWVQGLIIGFIPVGLRWIHYDYCEAVCAIDWSSEGADKFVIVAFVTCFITPALTMVVCYTIIFREVKRSLSLGQNTAPSKASQKGSRCNIFKTSTSTDKSASTPDLCQDQGQRIRRHNATVKESTIVKSLLIVVLVFFICMTPFSVTKLIKVLDGYVPCWVNTLATFVQLLASAFNPLIYGIFRKEYRKAFKYQYYKLCHRVAHRFHSTDYSDHSYNNSYYDNARSQSKKGVYRPRDASSLGMSKVCSTKEAAKPNVKEPETSGYLTPENSSSSRP